MEDRLEHEGHGATDGGSWITGKLDDEEMARFVGVADADAAFADDAADDDADEDVNDFGSNTEKMELLLVDFAAGCCCGDNAGDAEEFIEVGDACSSSLLLNSAS